VLVTTPSNSAPANGRSVLVVDDEPMIRRVAHLALGTFGYEVAEAEDVAAAVDAVGRARPPFDLVLIDLTMPGGDGAKAIPSIRHLSPQTRIVLMSGVGTQDAAALGADGFLAKPFTKMSLHAALERALGGGLADSPAAGD
jgi:CheY-like chemotaxis protein